MTTTRKLPADLHAAHEWTAAAGELDELASLSGAALDAYCRESAANWAADPSGDRVTESDVRSLAEWLMGTDTGREPGWVTIRSTGRRGHKKCLDYYNSTIACGLDHGDCGDARCCFSARYSAVAV